MEPRRGAAVWLGQAAGRRGRRRVPEATLLVAAGLFAAPGAVLGMYLFRHKTKKALFRFGVPALLLCQLLAAYALLRD